MAIIFRKAITVIIIIMILLTGFYFGRQYVMRKMYPVAYETEIIAQAKVYGVDPYLVFAVIWAESGYNPDAISPSGALGLMQIMPETGEWIAEKIGIEEYHSEVLMNPQVNISVGCWYLGYLANRFSGDMTLMLAAYNGGPNRVAQWLESPEYSDGATLKVIPYPETEEYIKKVKSAYEIYQTYYVF